MIYGGRRYTIKLIECHPQKSDLEIAKIICEVDN